MKTIETTMIRLSLSDIRLAWRAVRPYKVQLLAMMVSILLISCTTRDERIETVNTALPSEISTQDVQPTPVPEPTSALAGAVTLTPGSREETSVSSLVITDISAGSGHSLAVDNNGHVWTWGVRADRPFDVNSPADPHLQPVQVHGFADATQVEAGNQEAFILREDGSVWVWGSNLGCNLGLDESSELVEVPTKIEGLRDIVHLSSALGTTLAVDSKGTIWGWGDNSTGALGIENLDQICAPMRLDFLTDVVDVATDGWYSLALDADGNVWAWGSNEFGDLGLGYFGEEDGDPSQPLIQATPVQVPGLPPIVDIAAGTSTIAVDEDGGLWRWRKVNYPPERVARSEAYSAVPVEMALSDIVAVDAASEVLALDSSNRLWMWGYIGDAGLNNVGSSEPSLMAFEHEIVEISAGSYFILVLDENGNVWAQGYNNVGQLGNGAQENSESFVKVVFPQP